MVRTRVLLPILAMALFPLLAGCSPIVVCTTETVVYPDYSCWRVTRMEAFPNPRFPQQRPRLSDWFSFPPAELYDSYVVRQDKVLFAGMFPSFEQIPSDMVRLTPGASRPSGNLRSIRLMDMVMFVLADFDETLTDIVVSREDGEAALAELVRLIVPEVMSVLNAKYGQRYDLSRLESWLNHDLPAKLQRIYAGAWAIQSAKRSSVTAPDEILEFYLFLQAEAKREGLELAELGSSSDLDRENVRRLKEYGVRLAQQLVVSRQGGPVGQDALAGFAAEDLIAAVQQAVTARHGSVNNYIGKIASLVPRAFGTYLTGSAMPIYMLPETTYQYRLRVPGTVIQTNGVRELNGDLIWTFADRNIAFTGQSMWVRSIFVREPAAIALGVRGFPANLTDVDAMFGLCLSPDEKPREELLETLRRAVEARSLAPLESLAVKAGAADAPAARGVLDLFDRHRKAMSSQGAQANPPAAGPLAPPQAIQPAPAAQPAQPQTGQGSAVTQPPGNAQPMGAATPPAGGTAPSPVDRVVSGGNPLAPMQPIDAGAGRPAAPAPTGQAQPFAAPLEPPPLPPPVR